MGVFSFVFSQFRVASHIGPLMRWHGFRPVIKLGRMELPGPSATVLFAADPCGKDWHVAQHNNLRANRGVNLPSLRCCRMDAQPSERRPCLIGFFWRLFRFGADAQSPEGDPINPAA